MTADRIFLARHLPSFCLAVFIAAATVGAFTGGIWASLGIGGALVMFAATWRVDDRPPMPDRNFLSLALSLLTVTAALNLRSSQPEASWTMWGQLVTIFLPLSLLTGIDLQKRAASAQLMPVLPIAAALGVLALGLELVLQGPILKLIRGPGAGLYQYDRGFSYLVVLAFPVMALIWNSKRRWSVVFLIALLFLPASYTASRAAKLALVLALLTSGAAFMLPVLTRRALMALPFAAALWPFAAQKLFLAHHDWVGRLPPSWQNRVEIWDYLSYRILERPFFGWGLNASRSLPFTEPHGALYHYVLGAEPHPHNAAIQLWVELGLPGLAFGIVFALLTLSRAGRLGSVLGPFALGAWVAAYCLAMISYNLWSDSLWAMFALTGFAFALQQKPAIFAAQNYG